MKLKMLKLNLLLITKQYTIIEQAQVNADVYKFDTSGKFGLKKGVSKMKVLVPHQEPFVLEVHYNADTDSKYTLVFSKDIRPRVN